MDSLIAFKGEDFVIVAADTTNAYSVLRMKVIHPLSRTTTIKFGISTAKNLWPLVENIRMSSPSAIIFKRILHSWSTKMESNFRSMTPPTLSAMNWPKPSEKDPTVSTASLPASKDLNLDCIGLTTWVQSLS